MSSAELKYFHLLKKKIGTFSKEKGIVSNAETSEWKGQDISSFQDLLMEKVNGRISEKWFYTHIKGDSEKLPRIDMLNLLSQYLDYSDWNDFINQNEVKEIDFKRSNFSTWKIVVPIVLLAVVVFMPFQFSTNSYKFCFVDADMRDPIIDAIEIEILKENESSVLLNTDKKGCFETEIDKDLIRFVARSAYYKTDTITRRIMESGEVESVSLRTNDYALMIHIFSQSNVKDWKKRRKQLDEMIMDDAEIIQVSQNGKLGMDMLNKPDFINKLTIPTSSLKNIEILETTYTNGKIQTMRFFLKEESNE